MNLETWVNLMLIPPKARDAVIELQAQAWEEGYKAGAGAYNESNATPEDFQEEAQENNPYTPKETQE